MTARQRRWTSTAATQSLESAQPPAVAMELTRKAAGPQYSRAAMTRTARPHLRRHQRHLQRQKHRAQANQEKSRLGHNG